MCHEECLKALEFEERQHALRQPEQERERQVDSDEDGRGSPSPSLVLCAVVDKKRLAGSSGGGAFHKETGQDTKRVKMVKIQETCALDCYGAGKQALAHLHLYREEHADEDNQMLYNPGCKLNGLILKGNSSRDQIRRKD